jgi:hypothetical protein
MPGDPTDKLIELTRQFEGVSDFVRAALMLTRHSGEVQPHSDRTQLDEAQAIEFLAQDWLESRLTLNVASKKAADLAYRTGRDGLSNQAWAQMTASRQLVRMLEDCRHDWTEEKLRSLLRLRLCFIADKARVASCDPDEGDWQIRCLEVLALGYNPLAPIDGRLRNSLLTSRVNQ